MTFDVGSLVNELNSLITLIVDTGAENKHLASRQKIMGFDVSANVSIQIGLESLNSNYNEPASKEPLVDVFADNDNIKLIALIPGINKEDIETNVHDGFIEVKIRKGNSIFYRNIPCDVQPDKIAVKSVTYNNSVLEIIFKKGDG